jgi:hypothetical protein
MHIRFILDERTFDISSDHELAVTFDLLARRPSIAPILHWEIIMQIPDQDLMTLI